MSNPHDALLTVVFRNHVMPDEQASKTAGRPIYNDIEVVDIHLAGNKKTVGSFPAHDPEPTATRERGEIVTYAQHYNVQYQAFKDNVAQPLTGTPLSEATFLTESKRRELKALKVNTIEALAALDGHPLRQLGMGGREWKNQAQAYLDKAAGSADVTSLAAQVAELQQALDAERALRRQSEQTAQNFTSQPAAIQPGNQSDTENADGSNGRGAIPPQPVEFADWSEEELKVFISEKTGRRPAGNPSHTTLVDAAIELSKGE